MQPLKKITRKLWTTQLLMGFCWCRPALWILLRELFVSTVLIMRHFVRSLEFELNSLNRWCAKRSAGMMSPGAVIIYPYESSSKFMTFFLYKTHVSEDFSLKRIMFWSKETERKKYVEFEQVKITDFIETNWTSPVLFVIVITQRF